MISLFQLSLPALKSIVIMKVLITVDFVQFSCSVKKRLGFPQTYGTSRENQFLLGGWGGDGLPRGK